MHDGVERTVDGGADARRGAEVLSGRSFLIARHVEHVVDELVHTLSVDGANGHHGDAEQMLQLVDAYGAALTLQFVDEVEGQHHRAAQFHKLHGEVEAALDAGGVDDVDDGVGLLLQHEAA